MFSSINFAIVLENNYDSEVELAEGNDHIYKRISKMYDDVKFDIVDPWDLY